jgi:hypothetical protein
MMLASRHENNRPARRFIALADGYGGRRAFSGSGALLVAPVTKPDIPAPSGGATPTIEVGNWKRYSILEMNQGAAMNFRRPFVDSLAAARCGRSAAIRVSDPSRR